MEYPQAKVVSHPECRPEVCAHSDFVGSTSQMLNFMRATESKEFLMLTECGLSSRLQKEFPDKRLVGSCTLCKYMKSNTLEHVLRVLKHPQSRDHVVIDEDDRRRALTSLKAMFQYAQE